jgi:hypothetical protein
MSYVLSIVHPPESGAAYGKATVLDPVKSMEAVHRRVAHILLTEHSTPVRESADFANALIHELTGTGRVHTGTGLTFRIDHADRAPNACPCCGRLVNWQDHALAGSDDAYCTGCYTWGDDRKISCDPNHTAHHNPWGWVTDGARWHLHTVFEDDEGNTDSDDRYSSDVELLHDDPEDAALIAWPGLTREQIIEAVITEIEER